jgi:hypothetical protein
LKAKARDIVEICYADALKPSYPFDVNFNSDQYVEIVAEKVKALLDGSTFLLAPELDDQVWFHLYLCITTC